MAGRTGYTPITNASAMLGPTQITGVYEHFDALVGESKATASALPASGNWVGRQVFVEDTGLLYVCDALPAVWRVVNGSEIRALVSAARAAFTALGNNDLQVISDPSGMVSAAADTITVPISGIYLATFNMIQSGTTACSGGVYVNGSQRINVGATGASGAPANPSGSGHLLLSAGDVITFKSSAAASTTFVSTSTASVVFLGTA